MLTNLRPVRRPLFIICFILFIFMVFRYSPDAYALTVPGAKALPYLTGDAVTDVINVAISQVGYTGVKDSSGNRYSVYSEWAGTPGTKWCSEFVAWCFDQAYVPRDIVPFCTSCTQYRNAFGAEGRYYLLENGKSHTNDGCLPWAAGTITIDQVQPGDIILMTTSNHNYSGGVTHTGLVIHVDLENNLIDTIEGNLENKVKKKSRSPSMIHGICRPDYETSRVPRAVCLDTHAFRLYTNLSSSYSERTLFPSTEGGVGYIDLTSSNEQVAKISNDNQVVAVRAGEAVITASADIDGFTFMDTCVVTVIDPSLTLNCNSLKLYAGGCKSEYRIAQLEASATEQLADIHYSSSNSSIATVTQTGVVEAVSAGKAVITASVEMNGIRYSDTCTVTVKNPTLKLSRSSITLKRGKSKQLYYTSAPSGTVTFKVKNKKICTVSSKGRVRAKKAGRTSIRVTCNKVTRTVKVRVKK